jgi:hypothetical protein
MQTPTFADFTSPRASAGSELEQPLLVVENALKALSEVLSLRDAAAIEQHAAQLQQALAEAMASFGAAARNGGVPPALRHRLMMAGGLVAAQRESLSRSSTALDRALDVLIPAELTGLYSAGGRAERKQTSGGSFQA